MKEQNRVATHDWFQARGPASLSNLGPGFDTLGWCIDGLYDTVSVKKTSRPGVHVELISGDDGRLPTTPTANTAAVAAQVVLDQYRATDGLCMRIEKGIPLGSGIGGSAASSVAGAWAANLALGCPFDKTELVEAVLAGEAIASGSRHGDNVLPALFGGVVLVSATEPTCYRQIQVPNNVSIALILPEIEILTSEARQILPDRVPLRDAVRNASALAFLLEAFRAGDWSGVGAAIMTDRLVEPVRAQLIPCYHAIKEAAIVAGAFGCALTGSGPAMFAPSIDHHTAHQVARAMQRAAEQSGVRASVYVVHSNRNGVTGAL